MVGLCHSRRPGRRISLALRELRRVARRLQERATTFPTSGLFPSRPPGDILSTYRGLFDGRALGSRWGSGSRSDRGRCLSPRIGSRQRSGIRSISGSTDSSPRPGSTHGSRVVADNTTRRRRRGRPSIAPGVYFRMLLVGYFEGIDSQRGIAWRCADSLGLRQFLGLALDESSPDHSTVTVTRKRPPAEAFEEVFLGAAHPCDEANPRLKFRGEKSRIVQRAAMPWPGSTCSRL